MAVQISGNDITVPRDGSFTRNVTIGGTLTYEDVTNIDSVGLVTARNGIEIGARPGVAASISVDGNMIVSGISTFNSRVLLGTTVEGAASADDLTIATSGNTGITLRSGTSNAGNIYFSDATSGTAESAGYVSYSHSTNALSFGTNDSTERLRINSSGHVVPGADSSYDLGLTGTRWRNVYADTLYGDGSNLTGIAADKIFEGNTEVETVDTGSDGHVKITTEGSERVRITSGGMVNINDTSNTAVKLYVTDTNPVIASFHHSDGGTNDQARISLGALSANPPYNRGVNLIAENNGAGHDFVVACSSSHSAAPTEKVRIDSSGRLIIGHTATDDRDGYNSALQVTGTGGDDSSVSIGRWSGDASASGLVLSKSRNGTIGSHTVLQANDILGMLQFQGDDGTNYHVGADIRATVVSGVGNDDMPADLIFSTNGGTTGTTERLRINSDGTIKYGTGFGSDTDGKIITVNSATHLCKTFLISGNYTMSSTLSKSNANSHPGTLEVRADADGPAIICGQLGRSNTAGAYSGLNISLEYPKLGLYAASVGGSYGSADFVLCNNTGANSAIATLSDERFRIYTNGKIRSAYTYSGTTTGGGPIYVESDGDFLRYTSSRKYKTDIETLEDARADKILDCRPVWYRSLSENDIKTPGADKSDWGWYGFIAEEVAEIEPRLVNWATKDAKPEGVNGSVISVERDPSNYEAEGVRYDNFVPLLVNLVKRQKAEIESLKARLDAAGL